MAKNQFNPDLPTNNQLALLIILCSLCYLLGFISGPTKEYYFMIHSFEIGYCGNLEIKK